MVVANFATTEKYGRRDGFTQVIDMEYYNLDVIISVGYRVKSSQVISMWLEVFFVLKFVGK